MRIYDPLYGQFDVPMALADLLTTPEVRRLSQVRLLNTLTPSLATLGELRRYSHTLGVLFLAHEVGLRAFSPEERNAFFASVLLHDVGTPPFGHLFEYHLRESVDWNHEKAIPRILRGFHAPENTAHQLFGSRTIEFRAALKRNGISSEIVELIVSNEHPLSQLLFGRLDLDNLDNVARMGWSLGHSSGAILARRIAERLSVDRRGTLLLSESSGDLVDEWATLRRTIYDILVFDAPTVAAQAVLSEAIEAAFASQDLSFDDWSLSDEDLVSRLRSTSTTKKGMIEYLGRLPAHAFTLQARGTLQDLGFGKRDQLKLLAEESLEAEFPGCKPIGYVFVDSGAFEKALEFVDPISRASWKRGSRSASVVIYGFARKAQTVSTTRAHRAAERLKSAIGAGPGQLMRTELGSRECPPSAQQSLAFANSEY